jgi:betaine-homocysteine S-methyltransferase
MKKTINKDGILERLAKGVVLGAEGYIFELERRGYVKAGAYVPEVVLDHPEAVEELHREFLHAGAEVMVALTYYGHREKIRIIGRENELENLNRTAVRLAKKVAREGNALVAGNLCNTWVYDPNHHEKTASLVRAMYAEQLQWAVEEGIDFVIAETIEYLGEALIALEVIKQFNLPAMVTLATTYEKSKDDYAWVTACKKLEEHGADIVGLNCIRGPETMFPILSKIRDAVKGYVAAQPVPYCTSRRYPAFQFLKDPQGNMAFPLALDPYLHTRFEMAEFAKKAQKMGINYIGICCGGAPHHVRSMAESLGRTVPASRYSPDMSQHGMLGSAKIAKTHEREFLKKWKA